MPCDDIYSHHDLNMHQTYLGRNNYQKQKLLGVSQYTNPGVWWLPSARKPIIYQTYRIYSNLGKASGIDTTP